MQAAEGGSLPLSRTNTGCLRSACSMVSSSSPNDKHKLLAQSLTQQLSIYYSFISLAVMCIPRSSIYSLPQLKHLVLLASTPADKGVCLMFLQDGQKCRTVIINGPCCLLLSCSKCIRLLFVILNPPILWGFAYPPDPIFGITLIT